MKEPIGSGLDRNRKFSVEILGPTILRPEDSVQLTASYFDRDQAEKAKRRLAHTARKLITEAYLLYGYVDPNIGLILRPLVEGSGLPPDVYRDFFGPYETFVSLIRQHDSLQGRIYQGPIRKAMVRLIGADYREKPLAYFLNYRIETNRGTMESRHEPLPLATRNILAHPTDNPNTLDAEGKQIARSIELLKQWIHSLRE